jgi:hypothetical protein
VDGESFPIIREAGMRQMNYFELLVRHLFEECLVADEENERSWFGDSYKLGLARVFAYKTLRDDVFQ